MNHATTQARSASEVKILGAAPKKSVSAKKPTLLTAAFAAIVSANVAFAGGGGFKFSAA